MVDDDVDVELVITSKHALLCRNAGSALLKKPQGKLKQIVQGMSSVLTCPLTIKVRKGYYDNEDVAHSFLPEVLSWGAVAVTLHGRSRQQRSVAARQVSSRYTDRAEQVYTAVVAQYALPAILSFDQLLPARLNHHACMISTKVNSMCEVPNCHPVQNQQGAICSTGASHNLLVQLPVFCAVLHSNTVPPMMAIL